GIKTVSLEPTLTRVIQIRPPSRGVVQINYTIPGEGRGNVAPCFQISQIVTVDRDTARSRRLGGDCAIVPTDVGDSRSEWVGPSCAVGFPASELLHRPPDV